MKKIFKFTVLIIIFTGIINNTIIAEQTGKIKEYTKYEVEVSEKLYVPFEKSNENFFLKGFITEYGSGVTFKGYDKKGNPQFYDIELGWTDEKTEGICLFNDNKTIVIINDNDFGVVIDAKDNNDKNIDITDYTYDSDKKIFSLDNKINTDIEFNIKQNSEPAEIWIIEMETSLK